MDPRDAGFDGLCGYIQKLSLREKGIEALPDLLELWQEARYVSLTSKTNVLLSVFVRKFNFFSVILNFLL